jgi:hypothetical protein
MCNHIFSLRQSCAISAIGSTLAVEVVPTVATTATGLNPDSRSCATVLRKIDVSIRNSLSLGTRQTLSSPRPSAIAAFSAELWA